MIDRVLFGVTPLVILALCWHVAQTVRRAAPTRFTRRLLLALAAVSVVLLVLSFIEFYRIGTFYDWLTNLNEERNLGTIFSATLYALVALAAGALAVRGRLPRGWARVYWLGVMLLFMFFSIDEFFSIHEEHIPRWRLTYALLGVSLVALTALVYGFAHRDDFPAFRVYVIGLAVMGAGGILLERLLFNMFCYEVPGEPPRCGSFHALTNFEEFFEMVGVVMVLAALLLLLEKYLDEPLFRVVLGGGVAWMLLLTAYLFPLPLIESQFLAEPSRADYLDGDLSLLGYWTSQQQVRPGDDVMVLLYWRANAVIQRDYNVSVHLLSQPEVESVAQADKLDIGQIPNSAWLPGMVMRKAVWLSLPEDLPTPASYWLTVRVWYGPYQGDWTETTGVPVHETQVRLLTDDTLIVESLPALDGQETAPDALVVDYRFDLGLRLAGVDMADAAAPGETLPLRFWWEAERDVEPELTQFVHLIDTDGAFAAGLDQPPFAGRFPTSDFPVGMAASASWDVPLPDDLPPGEYRVLTGLYDPVTVNRAAVVGADGQPVQDNAVEIGVLTVTELR